jgi:hypothetical protein
MEIFLVGVIDRHAELVLTPSGRDHMHIDSPHELAYGENSD